MRNSEVLFKASQVIEERGWTRGTGWGIDTAEFEPTCIEGAIQAALGGSEDYGISLYRNCPAARALTDFMNEKNIWPVHPGMLFTWNDQIAESKEQVIEVLRACAISEKVKEIHAELDNVAALRVQVDEAYTEAAVTELETVA